MYLPCDWGWNPIRETELEAVLGVRQVFYSVVLLTLVRLRMLLKKLTLELVSFLLKILYHELSGNKDQNKRRNLILTVKSFDNVLLYFLFS